jgi:hypothetical protein
MPRHSKSKPLTDEERAELLAQVYALILSPQWKQDSHSAKEPKPKSKPLGRKEKVAK